nr:hypothetical protein [Brevundimonas diminuta]
MSDTRQSALGAASIHPADLPGSTLIDFDAFAWLMPAGIQRQSVERSARVGNFPRGTRFTPRAKMVWRADRIAAWLAAHTAALEADQ